MSTDPSAPAAAAGPTLWVDADACPRVIRDILFRVAERTRLPLWLVANQPIAVPRLPNVRSLTVPSGLDAADSEIVRRSQPGDLVVTADIPLAAELVANGVTAINPRGELYTAENIRQHLSMRNFMDGLRGAGIQTGGAAPLHARDRQAFANQLDRWLARRRL